MRAPCQRAADSEVPVVLEGGGRVLVADLAERRPFRRVFVWLARTISIAEPTTTSRDARTGETVRTVFAHSRTVADKGGAPAAVVVEPPSGRCRESLEPS